MKRLYPVLFSFLFVWATAAELQAQLSDLHYLPPLKQRGTAGILSNNRVLLSTPSTTAFDVKIYIGNSTTPVATRTISKTTVGTYDPGSTNNDITLLTDAKCGAVQSAAGLRFESANGEKFYVNYRASSGSHASSLTSKGKAALGTSFKWVGAPNRGTSYDLISNCVGIMATKDSTVVNFFGYNPSCFFRLGANQAGITDDAITVTLNAGQTYLLEAPVTAANSPNAAGFIGASITSNKDIAVSVGQMHYQPTAGQGTQDMGFDQIIPESALGNEFVFVRGNGVNSMEFPVIIASQNDTKIFVNGSETPLATINSGDYYEIPSTYYSANSTTASNPGANMYVRTSKQVYALQSLAGASIVNTGDINFIAPLSCLMNSSVDFIPTITDAAGVTITGGITIIAAATIPDADIVVKYGTNTVPTATLTAAKKTVAGTDNWKTYFIPNLSGNVSVSASGPIAVGFFGYNGVLGMSGYFSGFESIPTIEVQKVGDGCLPSTILSATPGYTTYSWFKNGIQIPGATGNTYTPTTAGDYTVNVFKGTCSFLSAPQSIYDCTPEVIVRTEADKNGLLPNDSVSFKVYVKYLGFYDASNMVVTSVVPSNVTVLGTNGSFGSITNSGSTYTWTIGGMRNGEEHVFTIYAKGNSVTSATAGTLQVSTSQTLNATESNKVADDFTETVTVYVAPATEPSAQPTGLYFTNTGDAQPYNNVIHFNPSASATGYLVVRKKTTAPDLVPVDGTNYTAGSTVSGNYILYSGTDTSVTDILVADNTDYHYAVYAYNGQGFASNYLQQNPLSGKINTLVASTLAVAASSNATSVGFPAQLVTVTFTAGVSGTGTSLTASKTEAIPANYRLGLPTAIRDLSPLYFTVTSTEANPGSYSIVLDYSALEYTELQWNKVRIFKRADQNSNWTEVTGNIVSRKVDGSFGKFLLAGLTSFSEFAISGINTLLPVKLSAFSATAAGTNVWLQWRTAQEQNAKSFEIEHSVNGRQWHTAGTVQAVGNSQTQQQYQWVHKRPATGVNYYRLQLVDRDGKTTYSNVQQATIVALQSSTIQLLRNPVSTQSSLLLTSSEKQEVRLMNAIGMDMKKLTLQPGVNTVSVAGLLPGVYFIRTTNEILRVLIL